MKRYMFNTLLLALTAVFTGCGGGSDDPQPAAPTITVSLTLPPLEKSGVFIPMATS